MADNSFFEQQKEQSLVKAEIVTKYFEAWTKVIIPQAKKGKTKKIAYIDLFCGPGSYKDGSKSTPILILERAINDPNMQKLLVTIFNDGDSKNTKSLKEAIDALPNINLLENKPKIENMKVGKDFADFFQKKNLIPSLFFIDPWGYKGLSQKLIESVIKDWGCDCIFFFNYNRINPGLSNRSVEKNMNDLFSREKADELRSQLKTKTPHERELIIIEYISQAVKEIGGKYVLPFCFKNKKGTRTTHHLIFVSKHELGYSIMKDIMANASSSTEQGVPSFEYNPDARLQPPLFELSRPLDDLENMLLDEFAGQTLTRKDIYHRHHIGKRYIERNYKDALLKLEEQEKIITEPSKRKIVKGKKTFADTVKVTFSPK
jgi:three-Cys-motif partner protein